MEGKKGWANKILKMGDMLSEGVGALKSWRGAVNPLRTMFNVNLFRFLKRKLSIRPEVFVIKDFYEGFEVRK